MGVDIIDVDEGCRALVNGLQLSQLDGDKELTHVEVALLIDESLGHAIAVEHIVTQHRDGSSEGCDGNGRVHGGGEAKATDVSCRPRKRSAKKRWIDRSGTRETNGWDRAVTSMFGLSLAQDGLRQTHGAFRRSVGSRPWILPSRRTCYTRYSAVRKRNKSQSMRSRRRG